MSTFRVDFERTHLTVRSYFKSREAPDGQLYIDPGFILKDGDSLPHFAKPLPMGRLLAVRQGLIRRELTYDDALQLADGGVVKEGIDCSALGVEPGEVLAVAIFELTNDAAQQTVSLPLERRPILSMSPEELATLNVLRAEILRNRTSA